MIRFQRAGSRLLSLALGMVLATTTLAAPPRFETFLPEDCVIYVQVADFKQLREKLAESPSWRFFSDPAMQPYLQDLQSVASKMLSQVEQEAGFDLAKLLDMPAGQIALAFYNNEEPNDEDDSIYFLMDVTGNEAIARDLLVKLAESLEKDGYTKQSDGEVITYTDARAEAEANDPDEEDEDWEAVSSSSRFKQISWIVRDGLFLMANAPEHLSILLDNIGSPPPQTLEDNQRLAAARKRMGEERDIEFFLDARMIVEEMEKAEMLAPQAMEMGVDALQSLVASVAFETDDYSMVLRAALLTNKRPEFFDFFSMPPRPMKPEAFVPADIPSYTTFTWDIATFYASIVRLVNATNPGVMQLVETQLAALPDPNNPILRSIKQDLIDPLGDRVTIIADVGNENGKLVDRNLFVLALNDADTIRTIVERLIDLGGAQANITTKTLKGNKVYTIDIGGMMGTLGDEQDSTFGVAALTVTRGHLMFATHVGLLDRALNAEGGESLAESAKYQLIRQRIPSDSSMIMFQDGAAQTRAVWQQLRSGMLLQQFQSQLASEVIDSDDDNLIKELFEKLFDGSKLPEFDAVAEYFKQPSGGWARMDETGIFFETFTLKN